MNTKTQDDNTVFVYRYKEAIGILADFSKHYPDGSVETLGRLFHIWQKPYADLNNPDILQYSFTNSWQSWPNSVSIEQFSQVNIYNNGE